MWFCAGSAVCRVYVDRTASTLCRESACRLVEPCPSGDNPENTPALFHAAQACGAGLKFRMGSLATSSWRCTTHVLYAATLLLLLLLQASLLSFVLVL